MDHLDYDGDGDVTYMHVQPRNLSAWQAVAVVLRAIALIVSVVAEALMQFAYQFFGKAEYNESRKRFAAEAARSIETITGGD